MEAENVRGWIATDRAESTSPDAVGPGYDKSDVLRGCQSGISRSKRERARV